MGTVGSNTGQKDIETRLQKKQSKEVCNSRCVPHTYILQLLMLTIGTWEA